MLFLKKSGNNSKTPGPRQCNCTSRCGRERMRKKGSGETSNGRFSLVRFSRIRAVEEVEQSRKHDKHEQTSLSASRAAGEPIGAVEPDVEQMSDERFAVVAGIRFREDDHVCVIRRRVEADR